MHILRFRPLFAMAAAAALLALTALTPLRAPSLVVTPAEAPIDVPLRIIAYGVVPNSVVQMHAVVSKSGHPIWSSQARFRADSHGAVDLTQQAPISGSYSGIHSMGLIWSMHQTTKDYPGLGSIYPGAITYTISMTQANGRAISRTVRRLRVPAGVHCADADAKNVVAYVCHPNDGKAHPGIIVLGGSEGGELRGVAALLAGHGYSTMALAYFGTGSLPKLLREIPVETVGRGLAWFRHQRFVKPDRIGIWGGSKGGELALLSATIYPQLRAVVSQYGSPMVWYGWRGYPPKPPTSSWSIDGHSLPFVPYDKNGAHLAAIDAPQFMRIEAIHGPILFIAGDDDKEWPSLKMARLALQRLREKHHPYPDKLLVYRNAGHGFSAPYYPAELNLDLGGTLGGDAAASEESWRSELAFFAKNLFAN